MDELSKKDDQIRSEKTSYSLKLISKISIIIGIVFFALHTLVYILTFRVNFPYGDDSQTYSFVYEYLTTGSINGLFGQTLISTYNSHQIFSLKLLSLPNLLFNNFDVLNFYYLQWIIMSLTLFVMFLIIKKTDKRLYWTLIPISAFIYCPIYNTGYFVFSSIMWLLITLCLSSIVYLLHKREITGVILGSSISIAIFASFVNLIGTLTWLIGIICLVKKGSEGSNHIRKYIVVWISSAVITGIIFILSSTDVGSQISLNKFLSFDGLSFFIVYLTTSFRFGQENIMLSKIVGVSTLIILGYLFYYFIKIKKNVTASNSGLLFIMIGIISGLIITLGRIGLEGHDGNESFYRAVSQFVQIGIIILVSMIILRLKDKHNHSKRNRNIKIFICLAIIISQMVFLIPSYYASWTKGEHYFDQKLAYIDCYSLTHGTECLETPAFSGTLSPPFEVGNISIINFWLENKLSIFGEQNFNQQNKQDTKMFSEILESDLIYEKGIGEIKKINNMSISEKVILKNEQFVIIEGWMVDDERKQVDSIFLMVDDKPFLKYDDFLKNEDAYHELDSYDVKPEWTITFLSGYLELGCHKISVLALQEERVIQLEQEFTLCK